MSNPLQILQEYVALAVERRMREVDVSDGSRVPHGSLKHVKDLEHRIAALSMWREKQKRGSEQRANYSRLISRLKGELASARRAAAKGLKESYATEPEPEQLQKWEKLARGETSDEFVRRVIDSIKTAESIEELDKRYEGILKKIAAGEVSSALSRDFLSWLYERCAGQLGVTVRKLR
jgi:hypothetical protein